MAAINFWPGLKSRYPKGNGKGKHWIPKQGELAFFSILVIVRWVLFSLAPFETFGPEQSSLSVGVPGQIRKCNYTVYDRRSFWLF